MYYKINLYKTTFIPERRNDVVSVLEGIIVEKKTFSVREISTGKDLVLLNENNLYKYSNFLFVLSSDLCDKNKVSADEIISYMEEKKDNDFYKNIIKSEVSFEAMVNSFIMPYYNKPLYKSVYNELSTGNIEYIDNIMVKKGLLHGRELCTNEKIKVFNLTGDMIIGHDFLFTNYDFTNKNRADFNDIINYIDVFNFDIFYQLLQEDYYYKQKKDKEIKRYLKTQKK